MVNKDFFDNHFHNEQQRDALPAIYKRYFSNRLPEVADINLITQNIYPVDTLKDVLTDTVLMLPEKIQANLHDINILEAIEKGQIDARSFDFEGVKYESIAATDVKEILQDELKESQHMLEVSEFRLMQFFYVKAREKQQEQTYIQMLETFVVKNRSVKYLKKTQ